MYCNGCDSDSVDNNNGDGGTDFNGKKKRRAG